MIHVNYVTQGGPHLVSYRGRIAVPAEYLRKQGWRVSVGQYQPGATVHVFSKHWNKEADLYRMKQSPCGIFDVCDDHFDGTHGSYYREMCRAARVLVFSSEGLRDIVGRGNVIYEPYELPEGKVRTPTERKALWFGHQANLYTVAPHIEAMKGLGWEVRLVMNAPPELPNFFPFSLKTLKEQLSWCHVVLLPQPKAWKSPNRMVEALRAGRFPLLDSIPAYEGWGLPTGELWNRLESCLETDWTTHLKAAQNRVKREFSPESVGKACTPASWLRSKDLPGLHQH
jgi:hypothetical protein